MCNPFGNDSICGYRPSLLAHDLTNMSFGAPMSAMNLHMNQAWADMQARSTLYMIPTMDFNNFTPYGMPSGGMDFLINPQFTFSQCQWNNANNGFNWGNIGGGFNMTNPWSNWGWNGGNTPGTSSNNTGLSDEEKKAQRKYNKLLALVKQLASDDSKLPAARKEALSDIVTKRYPSGTTWETKFTDLKAEYDRVSKNEIKKFLASNASIRFGIDGKDTTEANSFYGKLQSVGYEFDNSKVDGEIFDLYTVISNIKDTQENYQNSAILSNLAAKTNTYDILDVISSWNTQKKGAAADEKRIIDLIKKKYDALPSDDKGKGARESVKTGVISPLVSALMDRARGLKENLDTASQTNMAAAMAKLETAYNKTNDKVDANLSKAFDELYVLTRRAAIAQLRAEIKEQYGAIDPDLFNDELFEAETKADLIAEGFTESQYNAGNVTVHVAEDSGDFGGGVDETKPVREQLGSITGADKELKKAVSVSGVAGITEAWIDNNSGKVYVVTKNAGGEDEIHELNNPVVTADGKVTGGTVGDVVTANDIVTLSATTKRENEELKTEREAVTALIAKTEVMTKRADKVTIDGVSYDLYKETKGDKRDLVLIDGVFYEWKDNKKGDKVTVSSIEAAYTIADAGEEVAAKLCAWTTSRDDKDIASKLESINEDNVLGFMKGVYSNSSFNHKGCEGFIEKLDDDTDTSNGVTFDKKKNLIECFIEAAVKTGKIKEDDALIKNLRRCLEECQDGKDFNATYDSASGVTWTGIGAGAAVGAVAGAKWGAGIGAAVGVWFGGVGAGPAAIIGVAIGAIAGAATGGVTAWGSAHTNYNEVIDELMFDIYQKINA